MRILTFTEYMNESTTGGYGSQKPLEQAVARLRTIVNKPGDKPKTISARTEDPRRKAKNGGKKPPKRPGRSV